jgi:hypothetical protein
LGGARRPPVCPDVRPSVRPTPQPPWMPIDRLALQYSERHCRQKIELHIRNRKIHALKGVSNRLWWRIRSYIKANYELQTRLIKYSRIWEVEEMRSDQTGLLPMVRVRDADH